MWVRGSASRPTFRARQRDAVQALGSGTTLGRPLAKGHVQRAWSTPSHDGRFPGTAGPISGSGVLSARAADRVDGRQRRGGGRRHGLLDRSRVIER
jgi:hypothetical protein